MSDGAVRAVRRRYLEHEEVDDPVLSVVNIVDVFLVIIAVLVIILMQNPLNPFSQDEVVMVVNPGQEDMQILIKDGQELTQYEATGAIGEGQGIRAGIAYRLADGSLIYVPEADD
ncbi:DUF2149 domain-containing protein [Thiococcus pfennigii]|jgi:hypothetical protein|uniref:DUF2149 domain-containing protein n=1 Tax=Thiococcus pfennigii TaxID=1057 RepID=UPI001A93651A|nr:DUF2149 domain-containing protein [Thiococcus pfennigii]MBK1700788.1 hypothetical protein [Thiococcus pfennigii]MBK1730515.1 hypothetical protein [Thiococcus pfennigii]